MLQTDPQDLVDTIGTLIGLRTSIDETIARIQGFSPTASDDDLD